VIRLLPFALLCCGGGAVLGGTMLALGVDSAVGTAAIIRMTVIAAVLVGVTLGAVLAARPRRRPFRDGAVVQVAAGVALVVAALVPSTPGSLLAGLALSLSVLMVAALCSGVAVLAGIATGRPAWALAWIAAGAALASLVSATLFPLVFGRKDALIVASTVVAGTGLLRLEQYSRSGEPPPTNVTPSPPFSPAVSFMVGLAAMVGALLVRTDLMYELGDGPYVTTLVHTTLFAGIALGALLFAKPRRRLGNPKVLLALVLASVLGHAAFSSVGAGLFGALKNLPFYDFPIALTAGLFLALGAFSASIPLSPALVSHPGSAALGGLAATLLTLILPITRPLPAPGSIDAAFTSAIGGLLHPSPTSVLVIEDGDSATNALHDFPEFRQITKIPPSTARLACGGPQRFDLVVVNPGTLAEAAPSALHTREFHACTIGLLRPGGLVVHRLPLHETDGPIIRLAVGTFARTFVDAQLWTSGRDLVLVGAQRTIVLDVARLRRWFARPGKVAEAMRTYWRATRADHVLGHFLVGKAMLQKAVAFRESHSDDLPVIQVLGPWALGLRIPSPVDAFWRVKMLAGDYLPPMTRGRVAAASALAGAARGRHLSRSFAVQTGLRSLQLGGDAEARAALASLRTPPRSEMRYDAAVDPSPTGVTVINESSDELPIPRRLVGRQGLAR